MTSPDQTPDVFHSASVSISLNEQLIDYVVASAPHAHMSHVHELQSSLGNDHIDFAKSLSLRGEASKINTIPPHLKAVM